MSSLAAEGRIGEGLLQMLSYSHMYIYIYTSYVSLRQSKMTMDNSRFKDDIPNWNRICTGFSIATFVYILYSMNFHDPCRFMQLVEAVVRSWKRLAKLWNKGFPSTPGAACSVSIVEVAPWAWMHLQVDICALENSGLPGGMLIFTLTWACFMLRRKSGSKPRLGPFERRCPNWLSNRSIAWSHLYPMYPIFLLLHCNSFLLQATRASSSSAAYRNLMHSAGCRQETWIHISSMLGLCWAHVGPFWVQVLATADFTTLSEMWKKHESRTKTPPPPRPPKLKLNSYCNCFGIMRAN